MRRVTASAARPSDTTIVTVGAGVSPLVGALLADGAKVIAIDIATAALDALTRDLVTKGIVPDQLALMTADVRTVRLDRQVDVWHDRAVFHFLVDEVDRSAYVASAAAAVRPGGHLVIATFAPDGPASCSGLPVRRHDASSLADAFGAFFALVESFERDHATPWGATQRFTHAVFRRRG